jgi:hypothetical protein
MYHYNAVAFRGLTRASLLANLAPISNNNWNDFACDTVWMTRLARTGDLVRVPRALYHKRYDASTVHAAWPTWPLKQKISAWAGHCLDMLAEALTVTTNTAERRMVIEAARSRLLLRHISLGPYAADIQAMSPWRQWQMQAVFEASAAARSDIGPLGYATRDQLLRTAARILELVQHPRRT